MYISRALYFCGADPPGVFCPPLVDALKFVPLAVVTGSAPPNNAAELLAGDRDVVADDVR